jgi:hypothetical protein
MSHQRSPPFPVHSTTASHECTAKKGRPRSEKNLHRFIADALVDSGLLAPFAEGLKAGGFRILGASAEKVLILPLRELPFDPGVFPGGTGPAAKLPYDALVHLTLQPDDAGNRGSR